jgi:inosose dehydratase
MKIGASTYCLSNAIKRNEMNVIEVLQWIKDQGAEHVEVVPIGYDLIESPDLIDSIVKKAEVLDLDISNYAVGANFITENEKDFQNQIDQVKKHVDIARSLGVSLMRHDVASRPKPETSIQQFESDLPKLVEACQEIADYAAQYQIVTSVENHGFFIQSSDRIRRLIHSVNRPNFKATMDVGNFMCVDENSVIAVSKIINYASIVHLKDFYVRPSEQNPGTGFFSPLAVII